MKQPYFAEYFKDKRVTIMGLGLLGRGVGDAAFIAQYAKEVCVTDIKSAEQLAPSVKKLQKYKNVRFVLGKHQVEDFVRADIVVKGAGVPLDSPYIAAAEKAGVHITMSSALFMKAFHGADVRLIGVTGTRGKTTTVALIHHIMSHYDSRKKERVYLAGNIQGISTLALADKVKAGDTVVLELDSWQLQGCAYEKVSPHIAAFTNLLPDHMNYYAGKPSQYRQDKANIFLFQKPGDVCVFGADCGPIVKAFAKRIKSKVVMAKRGLPGGVSLGLKGEHVEYNAAVAVEVCKQAGIPKDAIAYGCKTFTGVPGRFELMGVQNAVTFINDTTSTTPAALIAASQAASAHRFKKIAWIIGGADKQIPVAEFKPFITALRAGDTCILLPGTGTEKFAAFMQKLLGKKSAQAIAHTATMREAVAKAYAELHGHAGAACILSPGFASFGLFMNEYDRGDQYNKAVKSLVRPKQKAERSIREK